MSVVERLRELGLSLPPAPAPAGNYVPWVRTGNLLFTAGQLPLREGKVAVKGVLGADLSIEQGQEAARLCCLAGLAVANAALGDLERVEQVVKVTGFVRSAPGFADQPKVLNGASDLLVAVFADRGRHARAALGTTELPLNAAVEIDFVFACR